MEEKPNTGDNTFKVQGQLRLEAIDQVPRDLELTAYVFDERGGLLGSGEIEGHGKFDVSVKLNEPADVELIVAPKSDPSVARQSAAYSKRYKAAAWTRAEGTHLIRPDLFIEEIFWRPWWPRRICISGHVRKVHDTDGTTDTCPVPYVKVEVFDVDREGCLWPYILRRRSELIDRRLVRLPDLIKEWPEPLPRPPSPDPIGPIARLLRPGAWGIASVRPKPEPPMMGELSDAFINPQPEPPGKFLSAVGQTALGPQPEPPDQPKAVSPVDAFRAGEMRTINERAAVHLDKLTVCSKVAPWKILPWCFYSKSKVCETFTDCNGYFRCCFQWWPWHFRRGRLRFDQRPDIVLRVTQSIDGVERVIYLDPYTSTRWNVIGAHIDLFLDDPDVVCGLGCGPNLDAELGDSQAALLQIGRDEVWKINQANGLYEVPGASNGAYGRSLLLRGDFSNNLKDGSAKRYYRLSYAKIPAGGGTPADPAFTPITTPLSVLRAEFTGAFHTYLLGPHTIGTTTGLYEVQDTGHWWMLPWESAPYLTVAGGTVLGVLPSHQIETDEGTYMLRMEVFDAAGNKMAAVQFPNHGGDGSGDDPDPPPLVTGHLDIKVHFDNKPLAYELLTPAPDECGIVTWTTGMALPFTVQMGQENGRVHAWSLNYVKGTVSTEHYLDSATHASGIASVSEIVSGAPMLADPATPSGQLERSCAFALILRAWSHVRVNYGWHRYADKEYAIAIERCTPTLPIDVA